MKLSKFVLFVFVSAWVSFGFGSQLGTSAARKAHENWRTKAYSRQKPFDFQVQGLNSTALSQGRKLKEIDFVSVPDVGNTENLMTIFKYFRDTRFIQNVATPKAERRISWFYPDDGCYVRAEMMSIVADRRNWPSMKKLFVFGNLAVRTRNTQEGMARWWYHVAPLLRTGDVVWVLDPSISYEKPLTVLQWKNLMAAEGGGAEQYALCDSHTFDPDASCQKPNAYNLDGVVAWQKQFSESEWHRVIELGRDPYKEL